MALAGCVAVAALTLLAPSAPTYDPWAWIVWGREILHLDLTTTAGPSWKPLPVAFTTVFALFGTAAPTLWVLVARAGALYGVVAAYRLAVRLGGGIAGGAAAAAGLLIAPWFLRNGALANSEGLQVAFALAAVERHLAGRRRAALALALGLGLLRPEAWLLLGLYGLWLVWRDRGELVPVAAALGSLPVLWLAPEQWGSGDWLRAAHRAQQPVGNSPAFSENPVLEVLREGAEMLTPPVWAGLAIVAVLAVRGRDRRIAALAVGVVAWVVLVAVMTANGYSGNQRYLIVPAALVITLAATGAGRLLQRLERPSSGAMGPVDRRWAAVAALGAAALFAAPSVHRVDDVVRATTNQARLADDLAPVVERAGGAARLRACARVRRQLPGAARGVGAPRAHAPGRHRPRADARRGVPRPLDARGPRGAVARRRRRRAHAGAVRSVADRGGVPVSALRRVGPLPRAALGLGGLVLVSLLLRSTGIHGRYWIDEGSRSASRRIRSTRSRASCGSTAPRRCTTCCSPSGSGSSATARRGRTRCRCCSRWRASPSASRSPASCSPSGRPGAPRSSSARCRS